MLGWVAAGVFGLAQTASAQGGGGKLRVFFIDVEGGQSTLFVTPGGESLLVDTGWAGNGGRDADRIVAAAKSAGLSRIDYVLLTHYHADHVGGVPQLLAKIPVGTFIDHGPNRELDNQPTKDGYAAYQAVLATGKAKHITAKVGDVLPIQGVSVRVISADGQVTTKPLPGGGQANPYCGQSEVRPADKTEKQQIAGH